MGKVVTLDMQLGHFFFLAGVIVKKKSHSLAR
jgi:hypothetical protein